jgi:uroporphyrinogen III methyltransferase / synthase
MPFADPRKSGRVYLVGAGPGDPRLITVRGVECLGRADVVLYDYLVNPQILEHAPARAELVCLGHHGHDRILSQAEINARLVAEAQAGKTVVRLKGGDPAIFARAAEEVQALAQAGIPFEIVPGITTALAAGSHAGISITHRELASAVALVTGQERDGKEEPAIDYRALAAFPGTLVFYMGVTSAPLWTRALVEQGKPRDTPAAIIRRCSWSDQQTIHCTLGTVAAVLAEHKMRPPVIVIVGDVVTWDGNVAWFGSRPLAGTRVVVTRAPGQAESLRDALQELGAEVLIQPAIQIAPPEDWAPVDAALARLSDYDWLVFSSANGVRLLLDRLCTTGDLRQLGGVRLAAIGPGTADELGSYRLKPDFVPPEYRAESLAEGLAEGAAGKRFLLARASRGREVLAERLQQAGGRVEQVVVYRSTDVTTPRPEVSAALAAGKVNWMTVTSSAIARSLVGLFGEQLRGVRLASISPVTSECLRELGYPPDAEATEYTMAGVVAAIVRVHETTGR